MMTNWSSRIDALNGQTNQTRRQQHQSALFPGFFRLELCRGGPIRGQTPRYVLTAEPCRGVLWVLMGVLQEGRIRVV